MRQWIAQGSYARSNDELPYADVADRLWANGFGLRLRPASPRTEAAAIAEAFRAYAAERYESALEHPELDWLKQPGAMARHYKKVADDLRAQADRVEAAADGVRHE
jgi:hypothetical protein